LGSQRTRDLHAPALTAGQRQGGRIAQMVDAQVLQQGTQAFAVAALEGLRHVGDDGVGLRVIRRIGSQAGLNSTKRNENAGKQ
jgi:hypothetical protein